MDNPHDDELIIDLANDANDDWLKRIHGGKFRDEELAAYTELAATADKFAKHCGVCGPTDGDPGDDLYYGQPISREVSLLAPLQGANEVEIVAVSPRGLEPRAFAWKPEGEPGEDGENPRLNVALGSESDPQPQYVREEANYLLDRTLQLFLVPVAFTAQVDGERGAAIHWVLNAGQLLHADDYAPDWIEKAAVLDYIAGQSDRTHDPHKKNANFLTHPDSPDRPILIDNGMSFGTSASTRPIMSDFINAYGDTPLNPEIADAVAALRDNATIWKRIAHLVGPDPVEQALKRIDTLIAEGAIPPQAQTTRRSDEPSDT